MGCAMRMFLSLWPGAAKKKLLPQPGKYVRAARNPGLFSNSRTDPNVPHRIRFRVISCGPIAFLTSTLTNVKPGRSYYRLYGEGIRRALRLKWHNPSGTAPLPDAPSREGNRLKSSARRGPRRSEHHPRDPGRSGGLHHPRRGRAGDGLGGVRLYRHLQRRSKDLAESSSVIQGPRRAS